jgi:hypothetical protein
MWTSEAYAWTTALAEAHNYPHFYYHAWQSILSADDLAEVERRNEAGK